MPVAKEMTLAELKKALRALPYDQMEDMICTLYCQSKDVSRYINAHFDGTAYAPKLLEDFKRDIGRFIPLDFRRPLAMPQARKILAAFRKDAPDMPTDLEILLIFAERCAEFTDTYGDIDAPFYDCAAKVFEAFVNGLNCQEDDALFERWRSRIDGIVSKCIHIGWGFGDEIGELAASIIWYDPDEQ